MKNGAYKKIVIKLRLTDFYRKNPNPSASDILKAVTEMWRVNLDKAKSVDYILALDDKDNLVGVYKVKNAVDTGIKSGNSTRKVFSVDLVSAIELMQDFIGQNLKNLFPKGSQNPINYGELYVELI